MSELSKLPNIGKNLEKLLIQAGIESAEDLKNLGSEQAFIRLYTIDNTSCFNKLCALEGAVHEIRWHELSQERKNELKEFLHLLKK